MKQILILMTTFTFIAILSVGGLSVSAASVTPSKQEDDISQDTTLFSKVDNASFDALVMKYYMQLQDSSSMQINSTLLVHPDFNYGPNGGPDIDTIINSGGILEEGDVGYAVKQLQTALSDLTLPISIDGYFGQQTYNCVISFQRAWNEDNPSNQLAVDGIVGANTWSDIKASEM